jgi:hypothetical protein
LVLSFRESETPDAAENSRTLQDAVNDRLGISVANDTA